MTADIEIVYRAPGDLFPYAKNPRTHSDLQVDQIAASIKEYGFTNPILIDEKSFIIAGHGRVMAAMKIPLERVPTITLAGLTDTQRKALVIADNKLALNSGWEIDLLRSELIDLKSLGFDMDLTGFPKLELDSLFAAGNTNDPDDAPQAQALVIAAAGEVWLLGDHRLVCGDSTDEATVALCLNGAKPHLMVTDPPYGVEYDAAKARKPSKESARGKVENDDRADWSEAWALFPGAVAYVWHAMLHSRTVADSLAAENFVIRAEIVWAKSQLVMSRGHYHPQHESCWYAVGEGETASWSGDRKQSTVWQIDKPQKSETGHSTQKPVECMKRPIENNSKPGDGVYEPFSGSGTTIIAAEMTARRCFAIELSPAYVDVAIRRWQKFSGKVATLEGTTKSFALIETERTPVAA